MRGRNGRGVHKINEKEQKKGERKERDLYICVCGAGLHGAKHSMDQCVRGRELFWACSVWLGVCVCKGAFMYVCIGLMGGHASGEWGSRRGCGWVLHIREVSEKKKELLLVP